MDRVTETEADLPALLDRVERGEEIEITRGGRPVAKLVAFDPVRPKPEDVVAHFRALRENLAARGVSFTWEELKEMRDEGRP